MFRFCRIVGGMLAKAVMPASDMMHQKWNVQVGSLSKPDYINQSRRQTTPLQSMYVYWVSCHCEAGPLTVSY